MKSNLKDPSAAFKMTSVRHEHNPKAILITPIDEGAQDA